MSDEKIDAHVFERYDKYLRGYLERRELLQKAMAIADRPGRRLGAVHVG